MPGPAGHGVIRRAAPRHRFGARLAVAAGIVALLGTLLPIPIAFAAETKAPSKTTQVVSLNPATTEDAVPVTSAVSPSDSPAPSPSDTAATASDSPAPSPSDTAAPASDSPAPAPTAVATPTPAPDPTVDYIVAFAAGTSAADQSALIAAAGATDVQAIARLRMHAITLRSSIAAHGVALLLVDPTVLRVDSDAVREAGATPSDTAYSSQWALPQIGWDQVFGVVQPSGSATVAILDTGIDASQPDLAGQLVAGTSILDGSAGTSDPSGHGTWMAGIIAAATDNGTGVAGVAYAGIKVMPVTVLGADGLGQDSDIIAGIVWAVDHSADVINLSFSNPGYSAALQAAIDYAWSHNVVVVAATGNDGSSIVSYPAGDRGVVGVSNTDQTDALNASSNFGAGTFLGAPGTDIVTTAIGSGTTSVTGTSASSAIVAAAAALLRAADPSATNGVIVSRLARTADAAGTTAETGNGRLNLARAIADTATDSVEPAGAAPNGSGGPLVGPYVAAAVKTWTGATSTAWTDAGNWSPSGAPASGDDVVLNDVTSDPILSSSVTVASVTINSGGVLTIASSGSVTVTGNVAIGSGGTFALAGPLTIGGSFTNNGTFTAASGATVTFNGPDAQTITGATTFNNLTVNKASGTLTLAATTSIVADLSILSGTLDAAAQTLSRTVAGGTITVSNGATLKLGGISATPNNTFSTFNATRTIGATSTIEFSGAGNQTVTTLAAPGYGNLTLSGSGIKTMPGSAQAIRGSFQTSGTVSATAGAALDIEGPLLIGSFTTFSASSFSHTLAGNWYNAGTFQSATSSITFDGSGLQSITGSGASAFNTLVVSKTAGSTLVAFTFTTTAGNLTVTSGVLELSSTANHTGAGGTLSVAAAATLRIDNTMSFPTGYASITLDPASTVQYDGTAQTVAAQNYGNLTISGARGLNNSVTLASSGAIGVAGSFLTTATFSGTGAYVVPGSTVNFNGTGAQTIPAFNYNNLTSSSTGSRTLASSGSIGVAGMFTPGTNAYTITGSTVDFNGTGAQTIPAFNYNNLNLSGASGLRTLSASGTVGIAGIFTPQTTGSVENGNTVDFNGTGAQTIPAFNYSNLTSSSTGARTLDSSNPIGVARAFTPGTNSYTIAGSTVVFYGSGAQTIPAFNYNGLQITGSHTTNNVTLASSGTIGVAGAFFWNPSFTSGAYVVSGSTIDFNGTVAQTIPAINYNNLTSSSSGARTLASSGTVGVAGTFTPGTNAYSITGSTVDFNGTGAQAIPAFNYNNLTSSSTGSRTLASSGTIGVAGTFTPGTNAYTVTGSTVNYNGAAQTVAAFGYNNLTFNGTGSKTVAGAISLLGNWTNNLVFPNQYLHGSNTVIFTGSATTQTIGGGSGLTNFSGLTVDKSSGGVTLVQQVNVQGTLALTSGIVTTGGNGLFAVGSVTRTASDTGNFVNGVLYKSIPVGSPVTRSYEVGVVGGSGSQYAPVDLAFASVTAGGTYGVIAYDGPHPSTVTNLSGISPIRGVKVYWSVSANSIPTFTTMDATFHFTHALLQAGADPSKFIVRKYQGFAWSSPTLGTRTATSTQATGMTFDFGTAEFAVGEPANADPDIPATLGQFKNDGTTSITTGGFTNETTVKLKATVSDPDVGDTVKLQIEVQPVGTPFTNTLTFGSSLVANGTTVTAIVPGLSNGTGYHWQARTVDSSDDVSAWTSFGGNADPRPTSRSIRRRRRSRSRKSTAWPRPSRSRPSP